MMQAGYGFPRFRVVKDKVTGLYKCHLCSYKSVYGSSLRSHFAVHSNARPYGCDMCSYEAKRLPDLKKHKILKHIRRNHSGTNILSNKNPLQVFRDPGSGLYRCQHCSYQSDNARCVRSHLAVHSHLRPYACDTCSYEAKRSSDLSKHKIIKHGRIPSRRNKSRKTAPEKADTVVTEDNTAETQTTNNVATSNARSDHQLLQQDLDRCDVLSDLDYSMMSPTRAALEALRRCNMEPLDMFNEYSNHDSFQHNPVFPEPEISNFNKRQYQNDQVNVEDNRGNNVNYGTQAAYMPAQQQNHNETTVFIKPEPPDDYFELMRCQNKVSTQNEGSVPEHSVDVVVCKSSPVSRSSQDTTTVATLSTSVPSSKESGSTGHAENSGVSTDEAIMDTDRPKSAQSSGSESHSSDKILNHLERRNLSGSSLIRPVMPNPRPPPEMDRASIECSQSRESGYSSPGMSAPVIQSLGLKVEMDNHSQGANSKTTNTRKSWSCHHCDIMFFDGALYFMHMGLHNGEDPWRCNMCCTKFFDVYGFTSHFVNGH